MGLWVQSLFIAKGLEADDQILAADPRSNSSARRARATSAPAKGNRGRRGGCRRAAPIFRWRAQFARMIGVQGAELPADHLGLGMRDDVCRVPGPGGSSGLKAVGWEPTTTAIGVVVLLFVPGEFITGQHRNGMFSVGPTHPCTDLVRHRRFSATLLPRWVWDVLLAWQGNRRRGGTVEMHLLNNDRTGAMTERSGRSICN